MKSECSIAFSVVLYVASALIQAIASPIPEGGTS